MSINVFTYAQHSSPLHTWFKTSNNETIDIKAQLHAPWSNTPDAHVSIFGHQLDQRQADCVELGVVTTGEDKVTHFITNMYASEFLETKTMEDWEDLTDQLSATSLTLFTAEYRKIQRALECASQQTSDPLSVHPNEKIMTALLLSVIQQPAPVP